MKTRRDSSSRDKCKHVKRFKAPLQPGCAPLVGYDPVATAGDCTFDVKAAESACAFFGECLTFSTAEWMGQLFALQDWQRNIIATLFGWKRPDGRRRYREAFIYVPRKNGKTELAAGLGNYLTFADGEPGAQVYCAAADREQARLVFSAAKAMVLADSELSTRGRVYTHSIVVDSTASALKVISAEAYSKHGVNAHGIIVDELHAQPNRELVDVLTTSTGARRQPLIIYITTADFDRESICNEKYDYACKVRDGVIDDQAFLPVIYEATKDDDWKSPATWRKVNPNLGVSITTEYMERECKRAAETPTYENTFKRLHLNLRTEQDVRWISMEDWHACESEVTDEAFRGRDCYAGLDLASTSDITAFVIVAPSSREYSSGDEVFVMPFFWVPEALAKKKEAKGDTSYAAWIKGGWMQTTPGNMTDYAFVRKQIGELGRRFRIKELAVDRLFQGAQLSMELQSDGFDVIGFGQGFLSMAAPTLELETLIKSRRLRHGGNPVMDWMASNVSVELDAAGNMKPTKKRSSGKIDGIVGAIMGIGQAMAQKRGRGPSVTVIDWHEGY